MRNVGYKFPLIVLLPCYLARHICKRSRKISHLILRLNRELVAHISHRILLCRGCNLPKRQIHQLREKDKDYEIINTETKQSIVTINKDSQSDENGNIVVIYPTGVQSITIKISDQEKVGRIQIETIKTISKINKDELKKASKIEQENTVAYAINNEEKVIGKVNSSIGLQETETSANLEINRTELSTMTKNENVEFRITLNSKNENNELFKNPVLKLELPEKIEGIEIKNYFYITLIKKIKNKYFS